MVKKSVILLQLIAFISLSFSSLMAQSDIGWRGKDRSGLYPETGLLKTWPDSGPSLLWETEEAGSGFSSVTVTTDAVYITGKKGDTDVLTAFNQSGKKLWEVPYGKASDSNYPDSRSTATYANGKLFVVSGEGDMVCISTSGKIIWSVNYFKNYGASAPRFGISESPLVTGNLVIGTPGGSKASVVAFDVNTGKVEWETPSLNEGTQYVNPLYVENKGVKMLVTVTTRSVIAVRLSDGKLLWKYDYESLNSQIGGRRNHTNTPLYRDGSLLVMNGYTQVAVKLKLNGENEPVAEWKNSDLTPHVGGAVLLGNLIFSSTHDTNSSGRWICVDWTSGKTLWINDWHNKGPIISADGMLYIMEEKTGNVALVKPSSSKLDVVSKFRITKGNGPYWAHPVISRGRLFIRHGEYLAVYSVEAK